MSSAVYALSIHADYRCRHSGACCSTDWDVPVELPMYRTMTEALASGRLRTAPTAGALAPFVVGPDLPDDTAAIFTRTERGECVFFERGSRLCIVHRDLGAPALPATCRHFPRLAVRDARGTSITLSHFCPTAAGMLFRDDIPLSIVEQPPAFPFDDYDGLSVDDGELPPLLTPSMLMDHAGYAAWERHMVARCAMGGSPEDVLATLRRDAAILRRWTPASGALGDAVRQLPGDTVHEPPHVCLDASLRLRDGVLTAVPAELLPDPDEEGLDEAYARFVRPVWQRFHAPLARYIAGKAFASWTAYQGRGVASIVRGLESAVGLVRVEAARECRDAGRPLDAALLLEAFRAADFALNHLAVGDELARGWSVVEDESEPLTSSRRA